jgi:ATP-dependent 26S proteasome regulatory subunit
VAKQETVEEIARKTEGFSGADLENIVNESAYMCVRSDRDKIDDSDLIAAFKKVNEQRH